MNSTTVALLLLLGVLIVAAVASRTVAVAASLVAFACFNFFFLPPVGTFSIAKRDDLLALVVLLAVSLIGSHLSHQSRERAKAALAAAHERNEAEAARRNADAKSALVASLSHDLKTPLTALMVSAGNLAMEDLPEADRVEQGRILRLELDRLRKLFDALIDLASLETRSITAELEWVHPADVVEAARRQAETVLAGRRVDVHDASGDGVVRLDPRLTTAALAHVLENAATYSPDNAPISIDVTVTADRLAISVRDMGPGLRDDEADRIFERFYRGAGATASPFSSGMGLAITRGLIAMQGGHVSAANHPGGGAVFTLQLPTEVDVVTPQGVDT